MEDAPVLHNPVVIIDVTDLVRSGEFWGRLLGVTPGSPRSNGDYLTVGPIAVGASLVLQRVEEAHLQKNPVHLDFQVADVEDALQLIISLGGKELPTHFTGEGVTVADPDGNEFCIAPASRSS
ncbi:VOC family protein [Brachybacterium phenoliresistens]|uniref:VOC family protein n=1 Tax=Brachybacterium phenoliresistens TaxID=396014 RepID=UPI0012EB4512|nr:VOC family protein [Brachybacterium phenoliresistens]